MNGARTWISFAGNGIRVGRSVADPRLPSWRRFEIRMSLQEAAKARGETLTREDVDYLIDKALAIGVLDSDGNGDLNCLMTGTRDEIIAAMMAAGASRGERRWGSLAVIAVVVLVVSILWWLHP
jgi:hypothetical protein